MERFFVRHFTVYVLYGTVQFKIHFHYKSNRKPNKRWKKLEWKKKKIQNFRDWRYWACKKKHKEKRKKLVLEIEKLIITFFILFVELRYILLSQFTSFEKDQWIFLKSHGWCKTLSHLYMALDYNVKNLFWEFKTILTVSWNFLPQNLSPRKLAKLSTICVGSLRDNEQL